MTIENNEILLYGKRLYIGMPFEEASALLRDWIAVERIPGENGLGHIMVDGIVFYGLHGSCTIHFQEGLLKWIGMEPAWKQYNLTDDTGKRLRIDLAVERVASYSIEGLRAAFGTETERSKYGNYLFIAGALYIVASIARSGEQYSVVIQ